MLISEIVFYTTGVEREGILTLLYDRRRAGALFLRFYITEAERERDLIPLLRVGGWEMLRHGLVSTRFAT